MCRVGLASSQPLDTSDLSPPTMADKVGETFLSRRVKCMDFGCNGVITLVGVALIAFAVVTTILSSSAYGWTLKMTPIYALLGVTGLAGVVLTVLSIKRMVTACHKQGKFHEDVDEVT